MNLLVASALLQLCSAGFGDSGFKAEARYRVELAGLHVGWARLSVTCGEGEKCSGLWESALRSPAEAGSEILVRRIDLDLDRSGRAERVRIRSGVEGRTSRAAGRKGLVPASIAELLLSQAAEGERRCITVQEEQTGRTGEACARREGAWLEGEVLGEPVRFRAPPGQVPVEVVLDGQKTRFLSDPVAGLPRLAPSLLGLSVEGGKGTRRFCGAGPDPVEPFLPVPVPAAFPEGRNCRETTTRYLERAAKEGFYGRRAVGLAFDGQSLVWHEWAELYLGGDRWIAIDPSFEQAPASGLRFTVARYEDGDEAGRLRAGRRILECWQAGR